MWYAMGGDSGETDGGEIADRIYPASNPPAKHLMCQARHRAEAAAVKVSPRVCAESPEPHRIVAATGSLGIGCCCNCSIGSLDRQSDSLTPELFNRIA